MQFALQEEMRENKLLWLLGSLCGLFRIPFDAALIAQNFPPPYTHATFHEAARALKLKTGVSRVAEATWSKLPMPVIAFERPAATEVAVPEDVVSEAANESILEKFPETLPENTPEQASAAEPEPSPPAAALLIVKATAEKILYFRPGSQTPETMPVADAVTRLGPELILVAKGNRIDAVLGSQVLRHLLRLPLPYFENRSTGVLVARLHGVETIREFVSGAAVTLLLDCPFLLIFLAVMFAYSWQLSLIAVGLLGLIALMSFFVAPVFREKLNRQFMLGARNQAFLTEYIAGMGTVKSLQMEPDIDKKYGDFLAQYLAAGFSTKQVGNTYNVVANALEQVMTLSILIVGMLVAFQMFAGRMSQPMLRLVGLWQEFQQADVAVKRLGDILDIPQEPHALTPSRENKGKGELTITNLAFRYGDHLPWLYRNLDLAFKPGHLTVIMGPSGCGKSTLAKLMLGFYQPNEGQIALDGQDIRHLAANELRMAFGVVPQETVLFSGTLYDNLVMAHPHATFDDVIAACKAAEIHDVIEKLPDGYQTEIGERGTGLSGGQK